MKTKMARGIALLVLIIAGAWLVYTWKAKEQKFNPTAVLGNTASPVSVANATGGRKQIVVQTGQERMSNAVRCMAFIMDLANKLPSEEKRHFMAVAGRQFFDDCLMAKISNGYVRTTTNELRQNFHQALEQVFTNHIPGDVTEALDNDPPEGKHWQQSPATMYAHDRRTEEHPDVALVESFQSSFDERNQMNIALDEQYRRMEQYPEMSNPIDKVNAALQDAGITDASESDLKAMCLMFSQIRTTTHLMYGAQSGASNVSEEQIYADNLNQILRWRLTNMYGLDDGTAQTLVQSLSRIPVRSFSHTGLQPPAVIQ
jgi:hypothetical protein